MKFFTLKCLIAAATLWTACQNTESEGGVREIRATDGPNSSLIRNPVSANTPLDTNQLARITFNEPEFDFGSAKSGEVVLHKFKFVNTGKVALTILNARAGCGCTIPEWPKEAIPPGGTGEISAKFNTEGREGRQSKDITVTANTFPNETVIRLRGEVKK
jgi:hypothetical protein